MILRKTGFQNEPEKKPEPDTLKKGNALKLDLPNS